MPKPLFIICSESGAEDKSTGLVSLFNVVDAVMFQKTPDGGSIPGTMPGGLPMLPFRVTSVWMRTDGEGPEDEFESQIVFRHPDLNKDEVVYEGTFAFSKSRQRFSIVVQGMIFKTPGQFVVESRVRRAGTSDWMIQDYPIDVEESRPQSKNGTAE